MIPERERERERERETERDREIEGVENCRLIVGENALARGGQPYT
jgi:hypothetical protein